MKTLANILTHESLPKRYNREYSDNPTISAQKNLEGRTHFVDPQTLKFHGSRVLSALPVSDGALYSTCSPASCIHQSCYEGSLVRSAWMVSPETELVPVIANGKAPFVRVVKLDGSA